MLARVVAIWLTGIFAPVGKEIKFIFNDGNITYRLLVLKVCSCQRGGFFIVFIMRVVNHWLF